MNPNAQLAWENGSDGESQMVKRGARWVNADAEAARHNGGMVALYPRSDFTDVLAVPGGERPEDMHCTLVYLGDNVLELPPPIDLLNDVGQLADQYTTVVARVFAHAVFNPDGYNDSDPAGVYLLGNSHDLNQLQREVLQAAEADFPDLPEQHSPWIPHVTASYGDPPEVGQYTGGVEFDRLGVAWGDDVQYFPLIGSAVHAAANGNSPHWPLR
jgi:hypothetical protein